MENPLQEVVTSQLRILMHDYFDFEQQLKQLPEEMQKQIVASCNNLEKALEVVPDNFEQRYLEAISKAIDLAGELENGATNIHEFLVQFKKELLSTFKDELTVARKECVETVGREINECVTAVEQMNSNVFYNTRKLTEITESYVLCSTLQLWFVAVVPCAFVTTLLVSFWAALLR